MSACEAGGMTYLSDCVFAFTFPVNCEPFDGFIPSKFTDYIQCNLPPAFYYIFFSRDSPTCVTTYVFCILNTILTCVRTFTYMISFI